MTSSVQYRLYSQGDIFLRTEWKWLWLSHQWSITAAQVVSAGADTGVRWQKCVNVSFKQLRVTGWWGGSFNRNTFLGFFKIIKRTILLQILPAGLILEKPWPGKWCQLVEGGVGGATEVGRCWEKSSVLRSWRVRLLPITWEQTG